MLGYPSGGHTTWGCVGDVPVTPVCDPSGNSVRNWAGVQCGDYSDVTGITYTGGNCSNVVYIELANALTLSGTISPEITKLTYLYTFQISNAANLTGTIPSLIGELTHLESLVLKNNGLTGPIPSSIDAFCNLRYLDLQYNHLNKSIPNYLCHMAKILDIRLNDNELTGNVPPTFCCLTSLTNLALQENLLQCYPECITNAPAYGTVYPVALPSESIPSGCFSTCHDNRTYANLTLPMVYLDPSYSLQMDPNTTSCLFRKFCFTLLTSLSYS